MRMRQEAAEAGCGGERQRDRETETERQRDRETERQRDRETERERQRAQNGRDGCCCSSRCLEWWRCGRQCRRDEAASRDLEAKRRRWRKLDDLAATS